MTHKDKNISKCLEKDDIILCEINEVSHDGCGCDGPESTLYDLYLFFERDFKIYKQHFHNEYWFHNQENEDEYFLVYPKEEITKEEYQKIVNDNMKKNLNIKIYE